MKYFVFETQLRPDGEVNVIPAVGRSTFALTLSYYYERASKMVANTEFTGVNLMLVDEAINVVKSDHLQTSYVAPETAPTEE